METQERVRRKIASTLKGRQKKSSKESAIKVVGTSGITTDAELDLRKLLTALQSMRDGDFSVRLPRDKTGLAGKVADTFNENRHLEQRVATRTRTRGQAVGKEGKPRHRANSTAVAVVGAAMEVS